MAKLIPLFVCLCSIYLKIVLIKCDILELIKMNSKLDDLISGNSNAEKENQPMNKSSLKLYENAFGNREGYHEELLVTNITTRIDPLLLVEITNYKFFAKNKQYCLAGITDSMFVLNCMEPKTMEIVKHSHLSSDEKISAFEVISSSEKLIIILSVETIYGTELRWYKNIRKVFEKFRSWPIEKPVKRLQYFQHQNEHRLLMLKDDDISDSVIDIYGFSINENESDFRLTQRLTAHEIIDLRICPMYQNTIVVLESLNYLFIYEYKSEIEKERNFELFANMTVSGMKNYVCFQTGETLYFATSGPNATIFEFYEDEFQFNSALTNIIGADGSEITWIESIPVDTYRDDVILLVQLKNSSVLGVAWQGHAFEKINLPTNNSINMNLTEITVIPNYGIIHKNNIIKIDTKLKKIHNVMHGELESLVLVKSLLASILDKQEKLMDKIESRFQKSYLNNPIITGNWTISDFEVESVIIENSFASDLVSINSTESTSQDFASEVEETMKKFTDFNSQLDEIQSNIAQVIPLNVTEGNSMNLEIQGDLEVHGVMTVENLDFEYLNNVSTKEIYMDSFDHNEEIVIEGQKTFSSINVSDLTVYSINGIPVNEIIFDQNKFNYEAIDFSKITKLQVEGDLNFTYINDIAWETLLNTVVSKSKSATIMGETVVQKISAQHVNISHLNGLVYPDDYVLKRSQKFVEITGVKKFKNLRVSKLKNLKTINGLPIEEYVTMDEYQSPGKNNFNQEITFENLEITGYLQINGNITDCQQNKFSELLINGTNHVKTHITFGKLEVDGIIQINESINNKDRSDFNDLISLDEKEVKITGIKNFTGHVEIKSGINITSKKINGHFFHEFVTLDTDQVLPNLSRIDANVTFGEIIRGDFEALKNILESDSNGKLKTLKKMLVFNVAPVIDNLHANIYNGNISSVEFEKMRNVSFSNVAFENLTVSKLHIGELSAKYINGLDYNVFMERRISKSKATELPGNYEIDNLYADILHTEQINGIKTKDLENLKTDLDDLYEKILNGTININNLIVNGNITVNSLNGINIENIYKEKKMPVIIETDIIIDDLKIDGFLNGKNYSEIVSDAVMKTDRNIIVTGKKKFEHVACEILDASFWNSRPIDNILNPNRYQVLTGPVIVEGTTIVENTFDDDGKVGDIYFRDIKNKINYTGDNNYILNGNFLFINDNITIKKFIVDGIIQNQTFDQFQKSIVFLDDEIITINGTKIFKESVTMGNLTVNEKFNEFDLVHFYNNVILINESVLIEPEIIFTDDVIIQKNLLIQKSVDAKYINGVDFHMLQENAVYKNQPTYFPSTLICDKVIINSDILIENINNMNLSDLIPLQEQIIDVLPCQNISVGKLEIEGLVNGHDLKTILLYTFLLTGDQNITGNITLQNVVTGRQNSDAHRINESDPTQFISLDKDEILIGNFTFKEPVFLNVSLRGLENLVAGELSGKQNITKKWTDYDNVHINKIIIGQEVFNGTDIKKLLNEYITASDNNTYLNYMCEDLKILQNSITENEIYTFKFFEYLQILNFDWNIVSVHHFEFLKNDYLFVNFENCDLHSFVFTGKEFINHTLVQNIGHIDRWITLDYEGYKYFVTLGKSVCNISSGNLWKFDENKLIHLVDLKNVTDARKINDREFFALFEGKLLHYSLEDVIKQHLAPKSSILIENNNMRFIIDSDDVLLVDNKTIYRFMDKTFNISTSCNIFGTDKVLSFHVGIYHNEIFIYYDEKVNIDYIFIADNNSPRKILQIIEANRPSSITMINFDGNEENFLIYIEDGKKIQIHEYLGIEGFVHRETLPLGGENLLTFKLRKHPKLSKKHCLGLINGKQLLIIEAQMYGEKLDIENIEC